MAVPTGCPVPCPKVSVIEADPELVIIVPVYEYENESTFTVTESPLVSLTGELNGPRDRLDGAGLVKMFVVGAK